MRGYKMITSAGFGVLESLVVIGMVAAFIMVGLVRVQEMDRNKKDTEGK